MPKTIDMTHKERNLSLEQVVSMLPLEMQERRNTGTTWTRNEQFDKDGYFVIKDLWDPEELYYPVPTERGQINYFGSVEKYAHVPQEAQVPGALARYNHPQYKRIHTGIRKKIEKVIGRKLYNTYYYDRYYFPGQKLERHADRDACEISVSIHVSTNLSEEESNWPIGIKTPDIYTDETNTEVKMVGEDRSVILNPGDGVIYKGCERPHWRDAMPGKKKGWLTRKEYYYHQIFFHYVLQDGQRAQCAWDRAK